MLRIVGTSLAALVLGLAGCSSAPETASDAAQPSLTAGTSGTETASAPSASPSPTVSPSAHPSGHDGTSAISEPQASTYESLIESVLATLAKKGPTKALASLRKQVEKHPAAQGICHAVAHELGHATLEKFHGNAAKALSVRDDICGGGFTHGIVEMALADSKDVGKDMLTICQPSNDGSCWHGVGHGVMFASKYKTAKAEKLCSKAPTPTLVARCAEGIYMQLFTLDDGAGHVAGPDFKLPTHRSAEKICSGTSGSFAEACWYYAPTVWLQERPEDWKGALNWCDKLNSDAARGKCTAGVGSRLVKYHPNDIPFAAKQCRHAAADVRGRCLAGMGSYWAVHWHGTKSRASVCAKMKAPDLEALCRRVNP